MVGSSIFTIMKLKDIVNLQVNNPDADFWLIRKGTKNMVGKPTREFSPEHIGVTITRPDLVLNDFLFYLFEYFSSVGAFSSLAQGTTGIRSIKIKDLGEVPITTA
jgi:hypothetical protein